jgi:hypothetical protein
MESIMTQSIQEYLGVPKNWKVKENIKHEILLMPTEEDISGATRRDPKACALHNAACRMYNIPNCLIGGRTAYIPQKDAKGRMYIAKMTAQDATRKAIRQFDKTGKMPLGGFRFTPMTPSNKTDATKVYEQRRYSRPNDGRGTGVPGRKRRVLNTRATPYFKAV